MKDPQDMTDLELAQEMNKRPDSLDYLRASAEVTRRQTLAQIEAARASTRNAAYMLISVIISTVSAFAAALSAYLSFRSMK